MIVRRIKQALCVIGGILAGIAGMLLFGRKNEPQIEEAKEAVKESRKTAGEILDRQKERKEKAEKMKAGLLVLLVCGMIFVGARAAQAEVYIPETYEEAVEYYLAAMELYESAEADADRLLAENNRLTTALESMIQYKQPRWSVEAGVFVTTDRPGLYAGLSWRF